MATTRAILISLGIDDSNLVQAEKKLSGSFKKAKNDAVAFQRELKNVGNTVDSLVPSFAQIGLFVGGLVAAFFKLKGYTDGIKDIVDQTQISAETIQEINYAAGQLGANTDALSKSYEVFYKNISSGSATSDKAIKSLGLTSELTGKSIDAQYNIILKALSSVQDPIERNRIAFDLFGKSAGKISPIFSQGAEGLAKLRAEANETGAVISGSTIDKFDELSDKWNAISTRITTTLVTAVVDSGLLEEIERLTIVTSNWIKTLDGKKIASFLEVVYDVVKWVAILRAGMLGVFVSSKIIGGVSAIVAVIKTLNLAIKGTAFWTGIASGGLSTLAGLAAGGAAWYAISQLEDTAIGMTEPEAGAPSQATATDTDVQAEQEAVNKKGEIIKQGQVQQLEGLKLYNDSKAQIDLTDEGKVKTLMDQQLQNYKFQEEVKKELEQATKDKKVELAQQLKNELFEIENDITLNEQSQSAMRIEIARKEAELKKKQQDEYFSKVGQVGDSITSYAQGMGKKNVAQAKKIQKAGLYIKLATEPYTIFTQAMANTVIPAPGSTIFAAAQAIFAAAKIKRAISDVDSAPSFAGGGIVQGSGSPTQDNIQANLSVGEQVESVADKNSFNAKLQSILDKDININLTLDSKIIAREITNLQSTIR